MFTNIFVQYRDELGARLAAHLAAQYVTQRNRVRPEKENHVREPVDKSAECSNSHHVKGGNGQCARNLARPSRPYRAAG